MTEPEFRFKFNIAVQNCKFHVYSIKVPFDTFKVLKNSGMLSKYDTHYTYQGISINRTYTFQCGLLVLCTDKGLIHI